jgi:dihydrofolate reductase
MRRAVPYLFFSLDGVTLAPDRWVSDFDAELAAHLKGLIASQDAVLLGRVTYQEGASYWPASANEPFASFINHTPKYVASTTVTQAAWQNTTLVKGSLAGLIARLKAQPGPEHRNPRKPQPGPVAAARRPHRRAEAGHPR